MNSDAHAHAHAHLDRRPLSLAAAGIVAALVTLSLTGCGEPREPDQPQSPVELPATWLGDSFAEDPRPWLDELGDEVLVALVQEAWAANPDVRAAAARMQQAVARSGQANAGRWPQVDALLSASRTRRNVDVPGDDEPASVTNASFEASLQVSWEIDVWGRLAAGEAAAEADVQSAIADVEAARLSLAAQVARAWYQTTHAKLQRDLAASEVENQRTTVAVFEARLRDGVGSALDVASARTDVAVAQAELAAAEQVYDGAQRDLEQLLGRYPAAEVAGADDLPAVTDSIPAGLPAALLLRRPDIRAAAARMIASDYRVSQAEADLLPRLSLTASAGTASESLGDLLDPDYLVWNIVGNLLGPLFDGGSRRAVVQEREAQLWEQAELYAAAVLVALREVEGGLAAEQFLTREREAREAAVAHSRVAELASIERYRDGAGTGSDLLRDQRISLNQRRALLQVRLATILNRIDVYLALGGDAQAPSGERLPTVLMRCDNYGSASGFDARQGSCRRQ